jgi:cell division septation protein DedD
MAVEDEQNEALEEVDSAENEEKSQDEENEDAPVAGNNPPSKLLIGLLSIVICFALFMFFRGEHKPALQVSGGPNITTSRDDSSTDASLPGDEDLQDEMIEEHPEEPEAGQILIQSVEGQFEASIPDDLPSISIPEKELAFFEALKKNKENRPTTPELDEQLSEKVVVARKKPEQSPKPKPAPEANPSPKKILVRKSPITKKPTQTSASVKPDLNFTIQLGAFKKETAAINLARGLKKRGYEAYIFAPGTDFFRVRVGSFQNRKEATVIAEQIRLSEGLNSFILKK